MEHAHHRATVSKRMRPGSDPTADERIHEGHAHQVNDHGDTLIRQQMSIADHIQVAAARKGQWARVAFARPDASNDFCCTAS
jgi:hypothetical protein